MPTYALVTGASSGIGRAVALLLADQRISLLLTGRNKEALDVVVEQIDGRVPVTTLVADLTVPEDVSCLIENLQNRCPDLIINSAGLGFHGPMLQHPLSRHTETLQVNCNVLMQLCHQCIQLLSEQGKKGVIVNISSIAGFVPMPSYAVYSATKAFVNTFSVALDFELRSQGIRVLTACPGPVQTQFAQRASLGRKKAGNIGLYITAQQAAKEIWWQIQAGKQQHTFGRKSRIVAWLWKMLPKCISLPLTERYMNKN